MNNSPAITELENQIVTTSNQRQIAANLGYKIDVKIYAKRMKNLEDQLDEIKARRPKLFNLPAKTKGEI